MSGCSELPCVVETVLTEGEVKPYICKLIAGLARLLLLMDTVFPGEMREKILVLYYRLIVCPERRSEV